MPTRKRPAIFFSWPFYFKEKILKTKPQKHQKETLYYLDLEENFAWFWDMGTGKTWLGCYKFDRILALYKDAKILIICPNTVTTVWEREILKHTFLKNEFIVLKGTKNERLKLLGNNKNIFIINFEGINSILPELQSIKWNLIIVDESQKIKNIKAKKTKAIITLESRERMILTGTPILNNYLDIFSQYLFLDRGKTFGVDYFSFRYRYFEDMNYRRKYVSGYFPNWQLKKGAKKEIRNKMKKTCFRLKREDCLSLPDRIFHDEFIDLTPHQKLRTKQIKRDCLIWLKEKNTVVTAQIAATKAIRFSQITSAFLKTEDGRILNMKENPKLKVLKEIVEEILTDKKNKIIIWAYFKHDISLLERELKKYNPVVLSGKTKDRQKPQDIFQDDLSCKIFIGQPQAAGLGLTLTAANYTIYYSYNYSAGDYWQSLERNYRKGSEIHKKIVCIRLICRNSIDEIVFNNLENKEKMANAILDYLQKETK